MERKLPFTAKAFMIALAVLTDLLQLLVGLIPVVGNAINIIIVDSAAYFIFGIWFLCYGVLVTSSRYWKIFFGGGLIELIAGFIPVIGGFIPAWTITIVVMHSTVEGGALGKAVGVAQGKVGALGGASGVSGSLGAASGQAATQAKKTAAEATKARESTARKTKAAGQAAPQPGERRNYESSPYYSAQYFDKNQQWDQPQANQPAKPQAKMGQGQAGPKKPEPSKTADDKRPKPVNEDAITDDYGRNVEGKDLERPYGRPQAGDPHNARDDEHGKDRQKPNPAFEDPDNPRDENEPEDWDLGA